MASISVSYRDRERVGGGKGGLISAFEPAMND